MSINIRAAAKQRWENAKNASIKAAGENADYQPIVLDESINKIKSLPADKWPGALTIGTSEIPCYVLDDGRRVITRTAATSVLTDGKGGGNLENYLMVENLRGFMPDGFKDQMIEFFIPGVSAPNTTTGRGLTGSQCLEDD